MITENRDNVAGGQEKKWRIRPPQAMANTNDTTMGSILSIVNVPNEKKIAERTNASPTTSQETDQLRMVNGKATTSTMKRMIKRVPRFLANLRPILLRRWLKSSDLEMVAFCATVLAGFLLLLTPLVLPTFLFWFADGEVCLLCSCDCCFAEVCITGCLLGAGSFVDFFTLRGGIKGNGWVLLSRYP